MSNVIMTFKAYGEGLSADWVFVWNKHNNNSNLLFDIGQQNPFVDKRSVALHIKYINIKKYINININDKSAFTAMINLVNLHLQN